LWPLAEVRYWLLIALSSHAIRRIWSAFDFIPKALAFERADPGSITEQDARKWSLEVFCVYRLIWSRASQCWRPSRLPLELFERMR